MHILLVCSLLNNPVYPPHGSTALVGLGRLCGNPRPHSDTPHSVGFLWTNDQLVAVTSTWQHTSPTTHIHGPAGFEEIPASERPQTQALDSAATGTGW